MGRLLATQLIWKIFQDKDKDSRSIQNVVKTICQLCVFYNIMHYIFLNWKLSNCKILNNLFIWYHVLPNVSSLISSYIPNNIPNQQCYFPTFQSSFKNTFHCTKFWMEDHYDNGLHNTVHCEDSFMSSVEFSQSPIKPWLKNLEWPCS